MLIWVFWKYLNSFTWLSIWSSGKRNKNKRHLFSDGRLVVSWMIYARSRAGPFTWHGCEIRKRWEVGFGKYNLRDR